MPPTRLVCTPLTPDISPHQTRPTAVSLTYPLARVAVSEGRAETRAGRSSRVSSGQYDADRSVHTQHALLASSALLLCDDADSPVPSAVCRCPASVRVRVSTHHNETMLRLEVDAQSAAVSSTASTAPLPANTSPALSPSLSSTSLPSLNDLYRQQLLGLQPSHTGRYSSTATTSLATSTIPAPTFTTSLTPFTSRAAASVVDPSSNQPHPSSAELLPSVPQSLSAAPPSSTRTSVGPRSATVSRQSLSSGALRAARTSLGQHSSPHKLALNPSTAQHIAKHQSQSTPLTLASHAVSLMHAVLILCCRSLSCCAGLIASPAATEVSLTPSLPHSTLRFLPSAPNIVTPAASASSISHIGQENIDPNIQLSHSLASLTLHHSDTITKAQRDLRLLSPLPPASTGRAADGARRRAKKTLFPARDVLVTPLSSSSAVTPNRTPAVSSPAGSVSSASSGGSLAGGSMRRTGRGSVLSARSGVSGMR